MVWLGDYSVFNRSMLYIIGSGGLAKEVYSLIFDSKEWYKKNTEYAFGGYFDEDHTRRSKSMRIFNLNTANISQDDITFIAVGDPKTKQRLRNLLQLKKSGFDYFLDKTVITNSARFGIGTIVFPYVTFTANNIIGEFCTIYQNCSFSHDTTIGDYCNITPGVNIAGRCKIGNRVYLGIGSSISNDVSICDDVIIGAGAVVIDSIKEPGTYVGVPARKLK